MAAYVLAVDVVLLPSSVCAVEKNTGGGGGFCEKWDWIGGRRAAAVVIQVTRRAVTGISHDRV